MHPAIKWITGILAGLILVIIIVMFSLPFFIDPNDYKDRITQAVEKQTGRKMTIPGDIKLRVTPTLKVVFRLGDINLSSGPEFPDTRFLASELVDINLALWPLITSRKIQINNLTLKGVDVNLVRDKNGKANWEGLGGEAGKPAEKPAGPTVKNKEPAPAHPTKGLPALDIQAVKIADINVTYTDRQAGRTIKLTDFNLTVGHIQPGKAFPVDASFSISMDEGKEPMTATGNLKGSLAVNPAEQLFVIEKLNLQSDIANAPVPVQSLGLDIAARADLVKSAIEISSLQVNLDETNIAGNASITDLQNPSYSANLHIDQLNLDKYKTTKMQPAGSGGTPEEKKPAASPGSPGQQTGGKTTGKEEPAIIPAELLRGLTFDAEVRIDKLIAAKLIITDIAVKATGKGGLVRLQPFSANLYQGTITVNGDIDARPNIPEVKLTEVLKGVEMGPLFKDMTGKEEVKGTADINVELTTRGETQKELTRNANGTMKLSLADGEIAKLKIIDTIRTAKRLYEAASGEKAQEKTQKKEASGRPTSFADLTASGIITNGVFKNDDLLAKSELMKVTGKGTVNLVTEEIDYLLTIYLAKSLERDAEKDLVELSDTPIPYRVTGTFDNIEQSAALKEVLKAGAVKFLGKELEKQLGKGQPKDGTKKDSSDGAEELINKGLKSLFGD